MTWSSAVYNYTRHLKDIHKIVPTNKTLWCSLCNCDLGKQVAAHACFHDNPILVHSKERLDYPCDECSETFPSWRSRSGHKQWHKKQKMQIAYNKKHNLPIPSSQSAGPSRNEMMEVDNALEAIGVHVTDDDVENLVDILTNDDGILINPPLQDPILDNVLETHDPPLQDIVFNSPSSVNSHFASVNSHPSSPVLNNPVLDNPVLGSFNSASIFDSSVMSSSARPGPFTCNNHIEVVVPAIRDSFVSPSCSFNSTISDVLSFSALLNRGKVGWLVV